jgi:hypothetical protein
LCAAQTRWSACADGEAESGGVGRVGRSCDPICASRLSCSSSDSAHALVCVHSVAPLPDVSPARICAILPQAEPLNMTAN